MANPELLPTPAEPRELIAVTVTLDKGNLDWLDGIASGANRNRSDALREILTAVRAQQTRKAS